MRSGFRGIVAAALILLGSAAAAQDQADAGALPAGFVGDAAAGERVFRRCGACHAVGEGAENKVGPVLNGIVGRAAASVEGFEYSDAMQEAGAAGLVWTVEELQTYLERPSEKVPGTKMAFPGLRSEEQRNDVIAYIHEASVGEEGE